MNNSVIYSNHKFDEEWLNQQNWMSSSLGFQVLTDDSRETVCSLDDFGSRKRQIDTAVLIAMAPSLYRRVVELEEELERAKSE
jgi:hypothetical protein